MTLNRHFTSDGGPRYGIRAANPDSTPPTQSLGTAAAQAGAMDIVDLDIAAQFLHPVEMRHLRRLERMFGKEMHEARQHVKGIIGSSEKWVEDAFDRGDGAPTSQMALGRSAVLGFALCFLMVAFFIPVIVGFLVFLREHSLWTAAGAAALAHVVLGPVKTAARRYTERSGYKIREHAAVESSFMWDLLAYATLAEIIDDRKLQASDDDLRLLSAPWSHLVRIVEKTREIKAL